MASILALFSSVLWGTADYLAGNLTKRFKAIAVTGASQAFGLIAGIFLVVVTGSYISPNLSWDGYLLPAIGAGIATSRITSMAVRKIISGQSIDPSALGSLTSDLPLFWSVSQASKKVCRLQANPLRLVAMRRGICRVGLRGIISQDPVIRTVRID